jgi:hypothetical protein
MKTTHLVVAAIILSGGGFAGGRFTAKPVTKTVEVEKRVEVIKEVSTVVQKVDIDEIKKIVAEMSKKTNIIRERTVVVAPDGTKTETEKEIDKTETNTKTETASDTKTKTETESKIWKETVRVEEKERVVEAKTQNNWALGLYGGVNIPALGGKDITQIVPGVPSALTLGVEVEKRILGPIWGGAYFNNRLDTGLKIGVKW